MQREHQSPERRKRRRRSIFASVIDHLVGDVVPWLYWRYLRLHCFVRLVRMYPRLLVYTAAQVARSGYSNPGIALAYLSIVITVALGLMSFKLTGGTGASWAWSTIDILIGGILLVLALVFAVVISFLAAAPKALAIVRVEGKKASEVLMVLAAAIYALVWKSRRTVSRLSNALVRLQNHLYQPVSSERIRDLQLWVGWLVDQNVFRRYKKVLERLKKDQVREIQLIEEMILASEDTLGISPERLCGSWLHFSPTLFRERSQALYSRTTTLSDMLEIFSEHELSGNKEMHQLIDALIEDILGTIKEGGRRLGYQLEVMDNHHLNDLVAEVLAARSASQAVERYAECLAQAELRNAHRHGILSTIRRNRIEQRLLGYLIKHLFDQQAAAERLPDAVLAQRIGYLHRVQKAYPGVNPHLLLTRLLIELSQAIRQETVPWCDPRVAHGQLKALERLEMHSVSHPFDGIYLHDHPGHWAELPRCVYLYSRSARSRIATTFGRFLSSWITDSCKKCYIVTQGNSATVRHALVDAMQTVSKRNRRKVSLVCFPSEGDPYYLEPRRIIHALPDQPVISLLKKHSAIMKSASFFRILEPGDSVLLLLGTEGVDRAWCFVHPCGLSGFQGELRSECEQRTVRFQSIILAEGYKQQLIRWSELRANGHNIDQRVELFEVSDWHADRMITDTASFYRYRKLPSSTARSWQAESPS